MNNNGVVQVAFNDHTIDAKIVNFFRDIFKNLGYDINVWRFTDDGLVSNDGNNEMTLASKGASLDVFDTQIIDVFVTDVAYGEYGGNIGLGLAHDVKSKHNDILVIAASRYQVTLNDAQRLSPTFDIFVSKGGVGTDAYLNEIQEQIESKYTKNPWCTVDINNEDFQSKYGESISEIEITRILRHVTFSGHPEDDASSQIGVVELKPIGDGKSGSIVLSVQPYTIDGSQCAQAIIKIDRNDMDDDNTSEVFLEAKKYQKYVKWLVPYDWRPEVVARTLTSGFGAVVYSFVRGTDGSYGSVSTYIKEKKHHVVMKVFRKIFDIKRKGWYKNPIWINVDNGTLGLCDYYAHIWRLREKGHLLDTYLDCLRNHNVVCTKNSFRWNGKDYDNPDIVLCSRPSGGYSVCICHGDLHGDNVLIADEEIPQVVFIDFADTGIGHVFRDFISMEVGLRLSSGMPHGMSFNDLVAANIEIDNDRSPGLDCETLIIELRKLARDNFPTEPEENYHIAIVALGYRLLKVRDGENISDEKFTLLSALIMSSLIRIEEIGAYRGNTLG